jgi:hypothetical protein
MFNVLVVSHFGRQGHDLMEKENKVTAHLELSE